MFVMNLSNGKYNFVDYTRMQELSLLRVKVIFSSAISDSKKQNLVINTSK